MKSRSSMILVPLFAAATAAVYLAFVQPNGRSLAQEQRTLSALREEVAKRKIDIQNRQAVESRTHEVEAELADFAAQQLEPLLESYAMRAKSIVGTFASEAGLVDAEFSDRPVRALPVLPGKPVPSSLHARRPVLISCYGDYAAVVSFILRVEQELPYVTLGALRITPGANGPEADLDRAEIVLEWPAKGAVRQ